MRLTVADLAERFAVSHPTIYRWVRLGKLPAIRLGKRVLRFSEEEIFSWEQDRRDELDKTYLTTFGNESGKVVRRRKPRLKSKFFFAP